MCKNVIVLHGGKASGEARVAAERLARIPDDEDRILLATGRYIGEGFDDASTRHAVSDTSGVLARDDRAVRRSVASIA